MEIKNVKLITGEELVSETEKVDMVCQDSIRVGSKGSTLKTHLKLTNPLIVFVTKRGLVFMKWAALTKVGTATVDMNHVLYVEDVNEEIANKYIEQIGGIVVAKKPAIELEF